MERSRHLDVVRGLAILLVFLHHLPAQAHQYIDVPYGGRGVDLFFALSGFLVGSTALARQREGLTPGRALTEFVLLRTGRTWPLYVLLLAAIAVGGRLIDPIATRNLRADPTTWLLFLSNYRPQESLALGVLWSLAVEEHFYLLVALVILVAAHSQETLRRAFLAVPLLMAAVALVYRTEMLTYQAWGALPQGIVVTRVFFSTLARIDAMGYGLFAAALLFPSRQTKLKVSPLVSRLLVWPVLALLVLGFDNIPNGTVTGFTLVSVLCVACIGFVTRLPSGRIEGWLGRVIGAAEALFVSAGTLSYGLYLFHPLTRYALEQYDPGLKGGTARGSWLFLLCWLAVTWLLALASYHLFERRLLERVRVWVKESRRARSPLLMADQPAQPATGHPPLD